jgi:hypothetical protein
LLGIATAPTTRRGTRLLPFDIPRLLELIGHLLKIKWRHEGQIVDAPVWNPQPYELPEDDVLDALRRRGELGHLKGVRDSSTPSAPTTPGSPPSLQK